MSLTSYRAAPPRVTISRLRVAARELLVCPICFANRVAGCSTPRHHFCRLQSPAPTSVGPAILAPAAQGTAIRPCGPAGAGFGPGHAAFVRKGAVGGKGG